jgi:hypothetical protein
VGTRIGHTHWAPRTGHTHWAPRTGSSLH